MATKKKNKVRYYTIAEASQMLGFREVHHFITVLETFPIELRAVYRKYWRKGRPKSFQDKETSFISTAKLRNSKRQLRFKCKFNDLHLTNDEIKLIEKCNIQDLPVIDKFRSKLNKLKTDQEYRKKHLLHKNLKDKELTKVKNSSIKYIEADNTVIKSGVTYKLSKLQFVIFKVYLKAMTDHQRNKELLPSIEQDKAIRKAKKEIGQSVKAKSELNPGQAVYRLAQSFRSNNDDRYKELFMSVKKKGHYKLRLR